MYGKLFASLYQGTLRGNADCILVFTNLIAHMDSGCWVDKHPRAIADEVGISVDRVRAALDELERPDPDSRSKEEDGRRIVRIDEHRDWGWLVVNGKKYRAIRNEEERREQNRAAQARWRNKNKPQSAKVSSNTGVSAQEEEEEEVIHPPTPRKRGSAVGFDEFWGAYPRKVAKAQALKAWEKLAPDAELRGRILRALKAQAGSEQWRREGGAYIPYPASWLNGRRWEDEAQTLAAPDPEAVARAREIEAANIARSIEAMNAEQSTPEARHRSAEARRMAMGAVKVVP